MNCQILPELLGYHCTARTAGALHGLEIAAPMCFRDGRPVVFYVIEDGERITITDDGATLFHLANTGLPFEDRRAWRPIRDRAERWGAQIADDGSIETIALRQQAPVAFARFMAAMSAIIDWERDNQGLPQEAAWLADEAEIYLRAWKPQATVERDREVCGITGRPYRFDFYLDGELIDVITPKANAVGAILRKAADVSRAPGMEAVRLLAIVDDRRDQERAKQEIEILGSQVRAMPMSRLIQVAGQVGVH